LSTQPQEEPGLFNSRSPAFGYVILCGASLAVIMLVVLSQTTGPVVGLLIFAVGAAGVLTRMRIAPLLVVLLVAMSQIVPPFFQPAARWLLEEGRSRFRLSDVLLCASVLGYVAGHYRLQGLSRSIFPVDYRFGYLRRFVKAPATWWRLLVERRRSFLSVTPVELAVLVGSLPLWALAAHAVWALLAYPHDVLDWDQGMARLTIVLVVLVPGLTLVAAVLRQIRLRQMPPEQAALLSQDTVWNEMRGEHRLYTRWLAWFWLQRKEQDKERP
jgi:hypothetical protein